MKRYRNYDWLYNQYINLGKSTIKIGDKCSVTDNTISYWLTKYDIPLRASGRPDDKTTEEYQRDVEKEHNGRIKVTGDYYNRYKKIEHKCMVCGYCWDSMPSNILSGIGCPKCANQVRNHIDYLEDVKEIHDGNIQVLEEYKKAKIAIKHFCKICGHTWDARPDNILQGKGCPKCANNIKKSHDEYVREIQDIHEDKISVIGNYVNADTKIEHVCNECGRTWFATPYHVLEGHGCGLCNSSHGEELIEDILNELGIDYDRERTFENCFYKYVLHFDFYFSIGGEECLIEFDGLQHFELVEHFGGEENFEATRERDKVKNNFASSNGFHLLRVPYTYLKNDLVEWAVRGFIINVENYQ